MVFLFAFLVVATFYIPPVSQVSLLLAFSIFIFISYVFQFECLKREKELTQYFQGKPEPKAFSLDSDGACVIWSPEADFALEDTCLNSIEIFCNEMCDGCLYWAYEKEGHERLAGCGVSSINTGRTTVRVKKVFGDNLKKFIDNIKDVGYNEVLPFELKFLAESLQKYDTISI